MNWSDKYKKALRAMFVKKLIAHTVGLVTIFLFLFLPLVSIDGKNYTVFDYLYAFIKSLLLDNKFGKLNQNVALDAMAMIMVYAVPIVCVLVILSRTIKLLVGVCYAINGLSNSKISDKIIEEGFLLKNGKISKFKAKHYIKYRKVNGVAIFIYVIMILVICTQPFAAVILDIYRNNGLNLAEYGMDFIYKIVTDTDALMNSLFFCIAASPINFIFSLIVFFGKRRTSNKVFPENLWDEKTSEMSSALGTSKKGYRFWQ